MPSSRLIAALVLSIHMASFMNLLLLCDSLSTTITPSQSMSWLSVVVLSVRMDLLVVDYEGGLIGGGL